MATWRSKMSRGAVRAMLGGLLCSAVAVRPVNAQCVGDCNGDDAVGVAELILGVNMGLGRAPLAYCPSFACENDDSVPVSCLVQGVGHALEGCASCPLAAGSYTLEQTAGGKLNIATFQPFDVPAGGTLVADISAGHLPDCAHEVVVPFPGGFNMPAFCVPATGFAVKLEQTGCGVGSIDSNGGADYTVTEIGDTSDGSAVCSLPQACLVGQDTALRVDITVGDGVPDTCSSGTANVFVAVPVSTTVWLEQSSGRSCPPNDGTFDPDAGDELALTFSQVLDFTTDTNTVSWADLDGDGCISAGIGPRLGFSNTGSCLDLATKTLVGAATGPVSSAASIGDTLFSAVWPNAFTGPHPALGASCETPPAIAIGGTVHRCINP